MNILGQMKKDCMVHASFLGDYQSMSVNELADGYCLAMDTNDEAGKNNYISALILRFWYTIGKMYDSSKGINLEREDFVSWLVEAINYACKYRAWQDPTKRTNAQAAINQCISTIRLQHYYEYNLDKHRANYNTISTETPLEDGSDKTVIDVLEAEPEFDHRGSLVDHIVQTYINDNKVVEAIIFDSIAYNDCIKVTKHSHKGIDPETGESYRYTNYSHEFWEYKLIQALSQLPENYSKEFLEKYSIAPVKLDAALNTIRKSPNQKLYKYVRSAVAEIRANKEAILV